MTSKKPNIMLEQEYQYFLDHRDDLVKKYRGKQVVIKGDRMIGVYDTLEEAYEVTQKEHELGTFLIQFCETEENTPNPIFHSRVYFESAR